MYCLKTFNVQRYPIDYYEIIWLVIAASVNRILFISVAESGAHTADIAVRSPITKLMRIDCQTALAITGARRTQVTGGRCPFVYVVTTPTRCQAAPVIGLRALYYVIQCSACRSSSCCSSSHRHSN